MILPTPLVLPSLKINRVPIVKYSGFLTNSNSWIYVELVNSINQKYIYIYIYILLTTFARSPVRRTVLSVVIMLAVCLTAPQCTIA